MSERRKKGKIMNRNNDEKYQVNKTNKVYVNTNK